MSEQLSGTVEAVSIKTTTKSGKPLKSPLYSIKVGDDWVNFGFKNPNVQRGDYIKFNVSKSDYGLEGDASTIEKAPATIPGASQARGNRDMSIVYQSSRKDVIALLPILIENECLNIPNTKSKRLDAILEFVDTLTLEFAKKALDPVIEEEPVTEEIVDE